VITFTVLLGGLWAIAMTKAIAVRRRPVAVGPQEIIGLEGVIRDGGFVFVRGELWRAEADGPLQTGQHVLVEGLDGLALRVRAV
jgi:membrane-bound serine protease (ClpP class)